MTTDQDASAKVLDAARKLEPVIRQHADEAEINHRISQPVVHAMAEAGLFRMWVPKTLGGLEVDPLTFYQVVEEVARFDGSTGWCLFIGGATVVMGTFLADPAAKEVYGRDPLTVVAGSIAGFGKAVRQRDGYLLSGRWPYASGCQHSAWFMGFCHVIEDDQPRLTAAGVPEVWVVHAPRGQVTILDDTWDVSGLVGTGSHDFVMEQVFVPDAYTWQFAPGAPRGAHYQGPLYQFPVAGLLRLPMSAVALGIAQGALDVCLTLAPSKRAVVGTGVLRDNPLFQARIAEAVALVGSSRAWLHSTVRQAWKTTSAGGVASLAERAELNLAALNATRQAADAVQLVYMLAGGTANYRRSSLQRSMRDVHAVTQHVGMAPQQYEDAGRMLLGLSPLGPLLRF
jgi:alkylation response protein AidB-like acyl-CoA dehydrogenase